MSIKAMQKMGFTYSAPVARVKLYYPDSYIGSDDQKHGRCGVGRGILEKLVPDTIWGLDIREACKIHDHMYTVAHARIECKEEADRVFFNNMVRIVEFNTTGKLLTRLRVSRANKYYLAVKNFGGPAFWNKKNEEKAQ